MVSLPDAFDIDPDILARINDTFATSERGRVVRGLMEIAIAHREIVWQTIASKLESLPDLADVHATAAPFEALVGDGFDID